MINIINISALRICLAQNNLCMSQNDNRCTARTIVIVDTENTVVNDNLL